MSNTERLFQEIKDEAQTIAKPELILVDETRKPAATIYSIH